MSKKKKHNKQQYQNNVPIETTEKYQLPIAQIKKDLGKNLIFTFFAILLIIGMKIIGHY